MSAVTNNSQNNAFPADLSLQNSAESPPRTGILIVSWRSYRYRKLYRKTCHKTTVSTHITFSIVQEQLDTKSDILCFRIRLLPWHAQIQRLAMCHLLHRTF